MGNRWGHTKTTKAHGHKLVHNVLWPPEAANVTNGCPKSWQGHFSWQLSTIHLSRIYQIFIYLYIYTVQILFGFILDWNTAEPWFWHPWFDWVGSRSPAHSQGAGMALFQLGGQAKWQEGSRLTACVWTLNIRTARKTPQKPEGSENSGNNPGADKTEGANLIKGKGHRVLIQNTSHAQ